MKKQRLYIIATVFVTLFIFGNSMLSAELSTILSDFVVNLLRGGAGADSGNTDISQLVVIVRKTAHILEFALQGFLLAGCFSKPFKKRTVYTLFFGLITACTDEFIQLFSEGRAAMIQDVGFDFSGTVIGLLIFFSLYSLKHRKHKE